MKHIFSLMLLFSLSCASLASINSFEADFTQTITDEKSKSLVYGGHIVSAKPQNAVWKYQEPIKKDVYINEKVVTIIEPEIEQVIIKRIDSNFNFFNMIKNAEKIDDNLYIAHYLNSKFNIKTDSDTLVSISYLDEFENSVVIVFSNQKQNEKIDESIFTPLIPLEFDIINN